MAGRVEVTLLGFELEIVDRVPFHVPAGKRLPDYIRRPAVHRLGTRSLAEGAGWRPAEFSVQVFEHHRGMGVYRRIR